MSNGNPTIRLVKPAADFTMVPNWVFRYRGLKLAHRGLLAFLFSRPQNWEANVSRLAANLECNRETMNNHLNALEEAGLLRRYQTTEAGRFGVMVYEITPPGVEESASPDAAEPPAEFPHTDSEAQNKTTQDKTTLGNTQTPAESGQHCPKNRQGAGQQPGSPYAFAGRIIRLTAEDLARWEESFDKVPVRAHLEGLDAWLTDKPDKQKNWFHRVAGILRREQQDALDRQGRDDAAVTAMTANEQWRLQRVCEMSGLTPDKVRFEAGVFIDKRTGLQISERTGDLRCQP